MTNKKRSPKTGKAARPKASRAKGKKASQASKSGFIRSMPKTPAAEIIRLYNEKYGEKINASLIYNVRNNAKKGKVGDFIRSMPEAPPAEIIRLYKEKFGERVSRSLISHVRNDVKKKAEKAAKASPEVAAAAPRARAPRAAVTSGAPRRSNDVALLTGTSVDPRVVSQFRSAVLRIGFDRADTLLKDLKASLGGLVSPS